MNSILLSLIVISILIILFFLVSKMEKWEALMTTPFECGFTSYFFSRFSFSIHYFLVALIFLFLDLELCFIMPFFNESTPDYKNLIPLILVVSVLLGGLLQEWKEGKLDWMY